MYLYPSIFRGVSRRAIYSLYLKTTELTNRAQLKFNLKWRENEKRIQGALKKAIWFIAINFFLCKA